jgi:hypothetical protein
MGQTHERMCLVKSRQLDDRTRVQVNGGQVGQMKCSTGSLDASGRALPSGREAAGQGHGRLRPLAGQAALSQWCCTTRPSHPSRPSID